MRPFWFERLISNAPLANLTFLIVIAVGTVVYVTLPRARDPEINFNWVNIWTAYPGATAEEVEREVTSPLEDALRSVPDVRYVLSSSREGRSSILIRFARIDEPTFDKRINDVRREVLNKAASEFPEGVKTPNILEFTTSNGFPTAMFVLYGPVGGEALRAQAFALKRALERIQGVDRVFAIGFQEPEIHIEFDPFQLAARGIAPTALADQLSAWYRDLVAGRFVTSGGEWLARTVGRSPKPDELAELPVIIQRRAVPLREVAQAVWAAERAEQIVRYRGEPAVLLSVTKRADANTLDLVERLEAFCAKRNPALEKLGLKLSLVDDQTYETRQALKLMESNALYGFVLVFVLVALFLGWRLGMLVALGLPFALAGAFVAIALFSPTLNLSVLLGVVIALGMLVDDAVIIVEAIHNKIVQGITTQEAVLEGMREVAGPVLSAVLTTIAAFLPLMLLPGILGEFLKVAPMVVTVALLASLVEAYWMLPSHILAVRRAFDNQLSSFAPWREHLTRRLKSVYGRLLVWMIRHPLMWAAGTGLTLLGAVALLAFGGVRVQFFAFDTMRLFYVHIELPVGSTLRQTLAEAERVRGLIERTVTQEELRSAMAMAGVKFTEVEPLYGDHLGQVIVSLLPRKDGGQTTEEIIEILRPKIHSLKSAGRFSFLSVKGGPPAQRPISVKVKSDDLSKLDAAVAEVRRLLVGIPGVRDISDDRSQGRPTLTFRLDREAVARSGLSPQEVIRTLRLLGEGERVGATRHEGEAVDVIVRAHPKFMLDPSDWLRLPLVAEDGQTMFLGDVVRIELAPVEGYIRHYQLVRTVTVEAEIDRELITPTEANARLRALWQKVAASYPNVELDFTGELDDIQENLAALQKIFGFGVALIYLILAAEFKSYHQPLLILVTLPLAGAGVIYGVFASGLPLSLYTLYGAVALSGIAVNSAIVLIAAFNDRLKRGINPLHAAIYAARRRLIPILITSATTIAGLLPLAAGIGGQSLLWGPVASSIVWGLGFSTVLTLYVIPLLLRFAGER